VGDDGIRAAPKEDANITPAQMVYGTEQVLPGQPAVRAAGVTDTVAGKDEVKSIPLWQRSYAEVARGPVNKLAVAQYVYVRRGAAANPMVPPYNGPFLVLQRDFSVADRPAARDGIYRSSEAA
jgi:hypothetical protein